MSLFVQCYISTVCAKDLAADKDESRNGFSGSHSQGVRSDFTFFLILVICLK